MKKIYIIIATLLLATIAMAYLYFTNLHTKNNASELALNAVTKQCGLIFSFDNDKSFYDILAGQDLLQQTLGETKAKQLKNLGVFIKSPSIFSALEGQKTYIGINAVNNEVNFLITTQLKAEADISQLIKTLRNKKIEIKPKGDVYQLDFADSSTVFLGFRKELVLISNVITDVSPPVTKQEPDEFTAFVQENSRFNKNTLANLYINFDKIPAMLKNIISTQVNGELGVFNQRKAYAALTYSFSKNKILFNGKTTLDASGNYYHLFVDLPAQQLTIDNLLPSSTANYVGFAIDNYANWQKSLDEWMVSTQNNEQVKKQIAKVEQEYRVNLQEVLPKYFKNQFGTFQLHTGEKFGIIALSNGEKVGQLLLDISADYAPEIKIFKQALIPFAYFGEPFKKFERPFYTIIDNYLVMANNASSIESFLRSYKSDKLLINEQSYIEFRDQLSSEATVCFYVNNKNSEEILSRNLKNPFYKQYQSKSGFKLYNAFCYQLVGDRGKFLTNFLLYKNQEKPALADTTDTER